MDEGYCELSAAQVRITQLRRLLEEAEAIIEIYRGHKALNRRESQVLALAASGLSMKEIAAELGLSVKTIECYRTRLMHKLAVHDAVRLTHAAIKLGLVKA